MKKELKIETRETRIEKARATLKEVPTSTKVKAWTFQIGKTFFVITSYFMPRHGQKMDVYLSNRKGIRTSNQVIVTANNLKDEFNLLFDMAIEKLIPVEEILEVEKELIS